MNTTTITLPDFIASISNVYTLGDDLEEILADYIDGECFEGFWEHMWCTYGDACDITVHDVSTFIDANRPAIYAALNA